MAKSKSLASKLEAKLNPTKVAIPDLALESVIGSYLAPGVFATQSDLRKHLTEGALLGITTLASRYIGVPFGEYVIYNVGEKTTTLFPVGVRNEDLAKESKPQEVHTSRLLGHWDKIRRSLTELNNQPGGVETMGKKERVQNSHSKYPRNQQVKGAIEASGQSQEDLAAACGVDPSTVSRWTAQSGEGARLPSLDKALTLSKKAGVDIEAMFGNVATSTPKQKKTSGSGGGRNKTYSQGNAMESCGPPGNDPCDPCEGQECGRCGLSIASDEWGSQPGFAQDQCQCGPCPHCNQAPGLCECGQCGGY